MTLNKDQNNSSVKLSGLNDAADITADFDANDINQNKGMSILAYLGPLCFIPMFAAKDSKYARFHVNQGLVLFIVCVVWVIASSILNMIILAISWRLFFLTSIISLLSLVFMALSIIGIINVANGKAKELPVIGKIRLLK